MAVRRILTALTLLAALAACGGTGEQLAPPMADPPSEDLPTVEPPDDGDDDGADGGDGGDGPEGGDEPMPEVPPLAADWAADDARVELPNGWAVQGCEGDAPLLCVVDGGRQVGALELGRYPLPETHDGDDRAYLDQALDDFVENMRADRAAGCPELTFEATPAIDATIAGRPGLRGGFRLVDASGREVERHIVYWTVADGEHVTVTVPAYAADGCLESMGEFTPEDLGLVALHLDNLVASTPLPDPPGS